ncbi:hypothetical protein [Micromonospora echinospora]|uniref:hypothetical protein n=1 Tax=Micromonospora echinospora TaxID=1877 RepID=UPI003A88241D
MTRRHRYRVASQLAIIALVTPTSFLIAKPAQAYPSGSVTVRYAVVDTDNCARVAGTLPVENQSTGCFLDDPIDNTFFEKDAGGQAVKIQMYYGGDLIAKVEFHPQGEKLWVYDTKNDGDGVYTTVGGGIYYAPNGTDSPVDYRVIDLSRSEGDAVYVHVDDDPWEDSSNHITTIIGFA